MKRGDFIKCPYERRFQLDTIMLKDLILNLERAFVKYGDRPVLIEYDGTYVNMSGQIVPLYNSPPGIEKSEPSRLHALGLLTDSEE